MFGPQTLQRVRANCFGHFTVNFASESTCLIPVQHPENKPERWHKATAMLKRSNCCKGGEFCGGFSGRFSGGFCGGFFGGFSAGMCGEFFIESQLI